MTPQMSCKKSSHSSAISVKSSNVGSTGNLQGLIQTQDQSSKNGLYNITYA